MSRFFNPVFIRKGCHDLMGKCLPSPETMLKRFRINIPLYYGSARIGVTVGIFDNLCDNRSREPDQRYVHMNTRIVSLNPKELRGLLEQVEMASRSR
jgi:hypothetical protein